MVHTKHLDACVGACVKESQECKSAMFFYDSGECIINSGTASDRPDAFVEELGEKVVYFENGCIQEDQVRSQESVQDESLSVDEETQAAAGSDISIGDDEREAVLTAAEVVEKPAVAANLIMGPWSPWTKCDVPNGRRMRKRDCLSPNPNKDCSHGLIETQWCINNEPEGEITTVLSTNAPHDTRTTNTKFFGSLRPKEKHQTAPVQLISNLGENNGQWSDWSQRCQAFTPDRPCDPQWRFKIGFQTRRCLMQNNRCDGPLMRYCFIPCGTSS
uniref:Apple domain-containing protein n=1 Tax=Romanomermis culicivorax TaxID=13658 RepID=A0A915KLM4_ROMCU